MFFCWCRAQSITVKGTSLQFCVLCPAIKTDIIRLDPLFTAPLFKSLPKQNTHTRLLLLMRERGERERREQQLHGNMLIVHGRLKGETLVDDERYTPQRPFVPPSFLHCVCASDKNG